jgi:hypothetical protein
MLQRAVHSSPVTRHPSRRPADRRALLAGIHATAKQLGMADPDRHDLQLKLTGITSCRDMDLAQLQQVDRELRRLQRMMPPKGSKRRTGRDERLPAEPPTLEQFELIQNLNKLLGLSLKQSRALGQRILHRAWPQTREEANKIIEGLKAMQRRGWRPTQETA